MNRTSGWTNEYLCASLVEKLRAGKRVETREFLRPIFKWCKATGRYSNPEKAFEFVEWMVRLSQEGDATLQIPPQPHIQPNYALNTIVTASQRTSAATNALKAYSMMRELGYRPDVFTLTALLDVVGRNVSFDRAWEIYEEMKASDTAPNVVTYVTLIWLASKAKPNPVPTAFTVLDDAQRALTTVDASIYNAVLITCVRVKDVAGLTRALEQMKADGSAWNRQTVDLLAKMHTKLYGQDAPPLESPFLVELQERELVQAELLQQVHHTLLNPRVRDKKYVGCLGPEASASLRQEVIHHDMWKLVERFARGAECVRTDFETIIHQCRKRKWADQVAVILEFMERLGTEGFLEYDVLPKPELLPDIDTFRIALNTYFGIGLPDDAWKLYQDVLAGDFVTDEDFVCFVVQGFLVCGRADMASECYWNLRHDDRLPNRTICEGLMRGLGRDVSTGVEILKDIISVSETPSSVPPEDAQIFPPFDKDLLCNLAYLLMESCAVLNNPAGTDMVIREMQNAELFEGSPVCAEAAVTACLMAAVACHDQPRAHDTLFQWQQNDILPKMYVLHALVAESIAASPTGSSQFEKFKDLNSLPFKGFLKSGAVRHIDSRRAVIATFCSKWAACAHSSELNMLAWSGNGGREAIGRWLCHVLNPMDGTAPSKNVESTASLLFIHHAHTRLLRVRDKDEKHILARHIDYSCRALSLEQQVQLMCNVLNALPFLELPNRHQSRLMGFLATGIAVPRDRDANTGSACTSTILELGLASRIAQALEDSAAPLDVVRDLTKAYNLHHDADSCAILARLTMRLLQDQVEKPIKITQFWGNYRLGDYIAKRAALDLLAAHAAEDNGHAAIWFIGHNELLARQFINCLLKSDLKDLAVKLALRYDLQDDQQFRFLFDATDTFVEEEHPNGDPTTKCLELSIPLDRVIVVSTDEQLQQAAMLLTSPETRFVGMDAEWRPFATGSAFHRCSLLQLATEEHIFLFDMMVLEKWDERSGADATTAQELTVPNFKALIASVFANKTIVGYGIYNDLRMLWESYPDNNAYQCISTGIDLKDVSKQLFNQEPKGGLSGLVEKVLGQPLDKRMQRSDWQRRPLKHEQICYAALDAFCLIRLFDALSGQQIQTAPKQFAFQPNTST